MAKAASSLGLSDNVFQGPEKTTLLHYLYLVP